MVEMEAHGPRETLRQILKRHGESILEDPARVEGLLRDRCGSHRKEIAALLGALNERVPFELCAPWQETTTPETMHIRLVQQMEDHRGLTPEIAEWAVDSWVFALGMDLGYGPQLRHAAVAAEIAPPEANAARREAEPAVIGPSGPLLPSADGRKKTIGVAALLLLAVVALVAVVRHKKPDASQAVPSSQQASVAAEPENIPSPQTLLAVGTPVQVHVKQNITSDAAKAGQTFAGILAAPLMLRGKTIVPAGADAALRIVSIDDGQNFPGQTQMQLTLVSLSSHGKNYPVSATNFSVLSRKQEVVANTNNQPGLFTSLEGAATHLLFGHKADTVKRTIAGANAFRGATANSVQTSAPASTAVSAQPAKVGPGRMLQFSLMRSLAVDL